MPRPILTQIVNIILNDVNLQNVFKFNSFTQDIWISKPCILGDSKIITDNDVIHLKYYIGETYKIEVPQTLINEALVIVSKRNNYNPLKDYLTKLEWDGVRRINTWLVDVCGVEDNSYYRDIGYKVLCAAVWRVLHPGAKFDYMMILEGDQGIGKSTLINALGGEFYLDTHLSTNENKREIVDVMRTSWIIEISDLAGFRKNDVEYLKSFISRQVDRVRMPYARRSEDFPRQCIFIGTHNPSGDNDYFRDDTGNRRFWPVVCKKIDVEKMKQMRAQLWAEAMFFVKDGYLDLYLKDKESIDYLMNLHKERELYTPWETMIENYVKNKNQVSNDEIMTKVFHLDPGKLNFMEMRGKCTSIGIWMRKNGWVRGSNEKRGWYFKDGEELLVGAGISNSEDKNDWSE